MVFPARSSRPAASRRVCVYCGFSGLAIQVGGDLTEFRCPRCQGDLYARPPRSYLEMEGFVAPPPPGRTPVRGWRRVLVLAVRAWRVLTGPFRRIPDPPPPVEAPPARPTVRGRSARIHEQGNPRRRRSESPED